MDLSAVEETMKEMVQYLAEVDKDKGKKHPVDFLVDAAKLLEKNDVTEPFELEGLDYNGMQHQGVGKLQSFLCRAVRRANTDKARELIPKGSQQSDGLQSLLKAMESKKEVGHVTFTDEITNMSFANLKKNCWPPGTVVDELATEVSKLTASVERE